MIVVALVGTTYNIALIKVTLQLIILFLRPIWQVNRNRPFKKIINAFLRVKKNN